MVYQESNHVPPPPVMCQANPLKYQSIGALIIVMSLHNLKSLAPLFNEKENKQKNIHITKYFFFSTQKDLEPSSPTWDAVVFNSTHVVFLL